MPTFSDEYQDSPELTFPYRHKTFAKDEAIYFADVKTDADSRRIELFQEELAGDDANAEDVAEEAGRALVFCQARRWTLKLPKTFRRPMLDDNGEEIIGDDGKPTMEPHPLAGKVPPLTMEYVRKLPEAVLVGSLTELLQHYGSQMQTKEGTKSPPPSNPPDL